MQILLDYLETSIVGGMVILVYIVITVLYDSRIHKITKRLVWLLLALMLAVPIPAVSNSGRHLFHISLSTKQIGILTTENQDSTPDLATQLEQEAMVDAAREHMGLEPVETPRFLEEREPIIGASAIRKPLTTGMVLSGIWITGILLFLLYFAVLHGRWCRKAFRNSGKVQTERDSEDGRFGQETIVLDILAELTVRLGLRKTPAVRILKNSGGSPFTLGIWHYTVFLPGQIYEEKDLYYILKHELIHCKNQDILVKGIMLCINAVHWFNPMVWLMRAMINQDMELLCDEEVLQDSTKEERREYSEVIMSCISIGKTGSAALTTMYVRGTRFIKQRFRHIFDTQKRKRGIFLVSGILCAAVVMSGFVQMEEVLQTEGSNHKVELDYGKQIKVDMDGDGIVELVTIYDERTYTYGETQVRVEYKNGDKTWIEYPGYWGSYMVSGDLNGDNAADLVVFRQALGSTFGGGEVSVLYVEDGEIKEYTDVYIQNPLLQGEQPVKFLESVRGVDSSIGATIVEENGRALLRVVYLGDFEDSIVRKNSAKYIDCSYSEEGWVIENMTTVMNCFSDGRWDEILDFSFIYE